MQVSSAEDIASAEITRLIALPFSKKPDGEPIVVKIKAQRPEAIISLLEGIPQEGGKAEGEMTLAEVRRLLDEAKKPYQEIARMGLVAPAFSFGEREAGKAFWDDLHYRDQQHVSMAIVRLSGLMGGDQEDADFATFPGGERGGGQDGGRNGGAGAAAPGAGG